MNFAHLPHVHIPRSVQDPEKHLGVPQPHLHTKHAAVGVLVRQYVEAFPTRLRLPDNEDGDIGGQLQDLRTQWPSELL